MRNMSQIIEGVTTDFIKQHNPLPQESACSEQVVDDVNDVLTIENTARQKGAQLKLLTDLPRLSMEILISNRDDIALVAPMDKSLVIKPSDYSTEQKVKFPLAIYQWSGRNEGVWEVITNPHGAFYELAKRYKADISDKEVSQLFMGVKLRAKVIQKCAIPYYVAVDNGIFDVKNKKLYPFSMDRVFTNKIHTPLDFSVTNPHIYFDEDGSTLDVESWFQSLGDSEFVLSILEVIQRACIPLAKHNKMCLFYNTYGNNGKGTICQLIRNLIGNSDDVVNIPLSEFSAEFGLANLPKATAIVCDENDMGYIKGMANLKAVITGDSVTIKQKYQTAFDFSFNGLVLECVNELPRVDDKTKSFERRLHIIPFSASFTSNERKYIKGQFIYMDCVKKYILKKVLVDMEYRESFTETSLTKSALSEYRLYSNSVHAFLEEILPRCKWNLLPATDFLYEIYKGWYRKTVPSGKVIDRNDFIDGVKEYVNSSLKENPSFEWEWTDDTRSNGYIDPTVREPLLLEYQITTMATPMNISTNRPYPNNLKLKYSGLKRRKVVAVQGADDDSDV